MAERSITANRLTDGVVWLDSNDEWTDRLKAAGVLDDDALQSALEKGRDRDRDVAIDIRDIPVDLVEGHPVPHARRERLISRQSAKERT